MPARVSSTVSALRRQRVHHEHSRSQSVPVRSGNNFRISRTHSNTDATMRGKEPARAFGDWD